MIRDDAYFWSKNGRPSTEKDRDRNTACRYVMSHLKTEKTILKTYHVDSGEGQWSERLHEQMDRTAICQDLEPFVKYSVNKRRRWEAGIGVEMLEELQKMHDDMEVMVIERVRMGDYFFFHSCRFPTHYLRYFRIRKIHELRRDNSYQCTSVDSVHGQPFEHFLPENRSPRRETKDLNGQLEPKVAGKTKIAYHFFEAPKNYEVFLNRGFRRGSDETLSHMKRVLRKKSTGLELRYGQIEELDEQVDVADDHEIYDRRPPPTEFYNWDDHIVDRFVFVKRRGISSRCSSEWSLVSN